MTSCGWCSTSAVRCSTKTFSLTAPERLIIDLSGAVLSGDFSQLELKNTGITSIHSGHFGKSDTRIVLDLAAPMRLTSFVLPPQEGQGHRLVLDLTGAAQAPRQSPAERAPLGGASGKGASQARHHGCGRPGHGGKDPGAIGSKGQREKDVVLSIAQLLSKRLKREKGFDVKLVRNDDFFVPLRKRVDIARQHKADMFISVHADAAPRLTASGASVYALSEGGATSATARFMAQRENRRGPVGRYHVAQSEG